MNKQINRIPKIVHYCWFGGKEKPILINKCIESWKQNLPEYEIREWNEYNFDVNSNLYVKEAFETRKFAFVSDYVRVFALYHFGGIYLDTDVEVFKSFNDLLHYESFWGFEQEQYIATSTIGAAKHNSLIKVFLDSYEGKRFIQDGGKHNELTNVAIITKILKDFGLKADGRYQELAGKGVFFPQAFFSPYDYINCRKFLSKDTYTVHYFYKSWLPPKARLKGQFKLILSKMIGGDNIAKLRKIIP
ncbi:MAG: glycosyltransferase [Bacillota bacterium]|nr:glycosyltransferase [Bacillota bacterium]